MLGRPSRQGSRLLTASCPQDNLLLPVLFDGAPIHYIDGQAEAPKGKDSVKSRRIWGYSLAASIMLAQN